MTIPTRWERLTGIIADLENMSVLEWAAFRRKLSPIKGDFSLRLQAVADALYYVVGQTNELPKLNIENQPVDGKERETYSKLNIGHFCELFRPVIEQDLAQ